MTESKWQTLTLTLLRVFAAFVFMQHGVQKVMDIHDTLGNVLPSIAMVIETLGAAMIMFGLFTRPVAFLASGEMAVAYFLFHAKRGFWPVVNHGETPALLCFIFLYLSSVGAGPFSLDAVLRRKPNG
jgi:putative oxidoreductase